MSEQNKMIARKLFEEMENKGNLAAADEILTSDFVNHTPMGETHGVESAKQFVNTLRKAFPDLHVTIEDQVAEGDTVATRWIARGTHQGSFQGVPATNRRMEISGMVFTRIANSKVVEQWGNPDLFSMMRQLGALS